VLVGACTPATEPGDTAGASATQATQPAGTTAPQASGSGSSLSGGSLPDGTPSTTEKFISAAEASRLAAEANQGVQFGGEEFGLS